MNNEQLKLERNRFLVLNIVRISGAAMIVFAMAIIAKGMLGLPKEAGYVLLVCGIAEFIIAPLILAKAWSTPKDL